MECRLIMRMFMHPKVKPFNKKNIKKVKKWQRIRRERERMLSSLRNWNNHFQKRINVNLIYII